MEKIRQTIEWVACSYNELHTEEQLLVNRAKAAAEAAYAPYSNFRVGAALRLTNGVVVIGSNQENAAYPSGLCAERVALFSAAAQYPAEVPVQMAIIALVDGEVIEVPVSPCGACRQVFTETVRRYAQPLSLLLCGRDKILKMSAANLMPLAFGGVGSHNSSD